MKKNELYAAIVKKSEILSRGIRTPLYKGKPLKYFQTLGYGAGPQGNTYYYSLNDSPAQRMISSPLIPDDHHLAEYALKTVLSEESGNIDVENGTVLTSRKAPKYLHKKAEDGTLYYSKAPIIPHCYNTVTLVMGFQCRHFDTQDECRYCETTVVGKDTLKLPERFPIADLVEGMHVYESIDKVRSFTITSGTYDTPDTVVKEYITLLQAFRKKSDTPVHVQFEPVEDLGLIQELSRYCQSAGIFLEIFNEDERRKICPGKARIPREQYLKNWVEAEKHFDKGAITTTCLHGFDVTEDEILRNIEEFAALGVKTSILSVRTKSRHLKNYVPRHIKMSGTKLADFYIEAAKVLKKHGLISAVGDGAGCNGCLGCTAMCEAFEYIEESEG